MASNMGLVHRANSQNCTATAVPEARKTSFEAKERKPHASSDECPCRMCRKARMLERRSWEPLTFRDKVYCYGALGAGAGIFVLLGIAWLVSVTP